ncbi:MAG: cytochrome c [Candidatus Zixiibacteriota bacterium]
MKRLSIIALTILLVAGCSRHQPSDQPPVHIVQNMDDQPKVRGQAESRFFADGSAMREPVEGTVARGWLRADSSFYYTGRDADSVLIAGAPVIMSMERLQRGRERYDIYCSPCHGRLGNSQSIMVRRGMLPPPSFHEQRLRDVEDGHIFEVISNGIRTMPPYKYQIPVDDRWSIVGYVRALQRSHNATINDLPIGIQVPR